MNSQERGVREIGVVSEETNLSGTPRPLGLIVTFYVGISLLNKFYKGVCPNG